MFIFWFLYIAVGAIGASKNLRRFGQSIKRVAREVKEAETPGKNRYWNFKLFRYKQSKVIKI